MLKYANGTIVMQEVPDEISLAINVTGCQHKCPDCHSKYLWEDSGQPLLERLDLILKEYSKYISCVCIMGGDQDQAELIEIMKYIKSSNLKTCLYTGYDYLDNLSPKLLSVLDYVKVGHYDKNAGPLNKPTTNQHMLRKEYSPFEEEDVWVDITYKFWPDEKLI